MGLRQTLCELIITNMDIMWFAPGVTTNIQFSAQHYNILLCPRTVISLLPSLMFGTQGAALLQDEPASLVTVDYLCPKWASPSSPLSNPNSSLVQVNQQIPLSLATLFPMILGLCSTNSIKAAIPQLQVTVAII